MPPEAERTGFTAVSAEYAQPRKEPGMMGIASGVALIVSLSSPSLSSFCSEAPADARPVSDRRGQAVLEVRGVGESQSFFSLVQRWT